MLKNSTVKRGFLVAVSLLFAAAVTFVSRPAALGDAEAARQFMKLGKAAIDKRQFADAVTRLKKAIEEDPSLVEAYYWLAVAFDKDGDKAGAIQAYRVCIGKFEEKHGKGGTSKDEDRLEGLARKRLTALAAAEAEFQKLEQAFVCDLLKFAKDNFLRDPASCTKALEALLKIHPEHAEALSLMRKLGGPGSEAAKEASAVTDAVGPFKKIKTWKDLVSLRGFQEAECWEYIDDSLVVDISDCCVARPKSFTANGQSFAMELEARVLEEYGRGWLMGMVFGRKGSQFLTVFFQKSTVMLHEATGPEGGIDLQTHLMPPIDTKLWHRLGVTAEGSTIEVWFDRKKTFSFKHPTRTDLEGEIGMFQQRCKGEYRMFRLGKLE